MFEGRAVRGLAVRRQHDLHGFVEQRPRCLRQPGPKVWVAKRGVDGHAVLMDDAPIARAEVVALLSNVSDIAVTLTNIERLLGEDDGEEADED